MINTKFKKNIHYKSYIVLNIHMSVHYTEKKILNTQKYVLNNIKFRIMV